MGQTVYITTRNLHHYYFGVAFGLFASAIVIGPGVVVALPNELVLGQVVTSQLRPAAPLSACKGQRASAGQVKDLAVNQSRAPDPTAF